MLQILLGNAKVDMPPRSELLGSCQKKLPCDGMGLDAGSVPVLIGCRGCPVRAVIPAIESNPPQDLPEDRNPGVNAHVELSCCLVGPGTKPQQLEPRDHGWRSPRL